MLVPFQTHSYTVGSVKRQDEEKRQTFEEEGLRKEACIQGKAHNT
jgi:hypothetical protein